jgi:hypothetical protein
MTRLEAFNLEVKMWVAVKDNLAKPLRERIHALTELYFLYQGDVHRQANIVREIQDFTRP